MNSWQFAQQIKFELEKVAWPTGTQSVVFGAKGSVAVFAGVPSEEQIPPGFPWCLISIDGGDADEAHPEFITQTYTLLCAADATGDPMGEFSLIGGSVADKGRSVGRGVLEVVERVRAAVGNLTGIDGAQIQLSLSSTGSPSPIGQTRHLTLHEQSLTALCTSTLNYVAPQKLQHDGDDWTWQGPHVSDRFDFLQYRLVRKSGTSPSTDPSDGTTVFTGEATTFTGVATAGNTYTIFADYNARSGATVDGSSSSEVGSFVVVTV